MEYLLLIATDETAAPTPGSDGFDAFMASWNAYTQLLIEGNHLISGAALQPTATATTVRKSPGGASELLDGPFIETKEQIGGFYVVRAADLDEALMLAEKLPIPAGAVEVRPLAIRPDAG